MTLIVQSNVELKVGYVKHNAGKNIRKLSYSGYNLTNYNSKKGHKEVNLAPYNILTSVYKTAKSERRGFGIAEKCCKWILTW